MIEMLYQNYRHLVVSFDGKTPIKVTFYSSDEYDSYMAENSPAQIIYDGYSIGDARRAFVAF